MERPRAFKLLGPVECPISITRTTYNPNSKRNAFPQFVGCLNLESTVKLSFTSFAGLLEKGGEGGVKRMMLVLFAAALHRVHSTPQILVPSTVSGAPDKTHECSPEWTNRLSCSMGLTCLSSDIHTGANPPR